MVTQCGRIPPRSVHRRDVDWHVDRGIVAVACVGRDMIKVWPLPVETPWWEDGFEDSVAHLEP